MKKIMAAVTLVMAFTLSLSIGLCDKVYALDKPDVYVDKDGKIHTENISFGAFEGMAAGDSSTESISIRNNSNETVNFYISQDTIQSLEASNNTSGAAYEFGLLVGDDADTAKSLLNKQAGGYDAGENASNQGLAEVKELEDYTFFATLAPGESTNLYMALSINGEKNDIDYANAFGKIKLKFKISSYEHQPGIINVIKTNPVYRYVKTSDELHVAAYMVAMVIGTVLVSTVAVKNHRKRINMIIVSAVAIVAALFLCTWQAQPVMAKDLVTVTFRAGESGTIDEGAANNLVRDKNAVKISKNYIKITVDKKSATSIENILYQCFGTADPDILFGKLTSHDGFTLLSSDNWGVTKHTRIEHNEEYVLDYGVLVDPVMYTIRYVDVDSYDTSTGKYNQDISTPYINYGNVGDTIEMDSAVVPDYATSAKNCSFKLERGKDNGFTFFYSYVGDSGDVIENITYDTQYVYLTQGQTNRINTAAGIGDTVGTVNNTAGDRVNIGGQEVPLAAGENVVPDNAPDDVDSDGNDDNTDKDADGNDDNNTDSGDEHKKIENQKTPTSALGKKMLPEVLIISLIVFGCAVVIVITSVLALKKIKNKKGN